MTDYRKISIIIPNLHSPTINQTLDSLLDQEISLPYEIIVVGQDKFGIIDSYQDEHIKFIKTVEPTPPALARNLGVASSTGDYLVFTDSDCVPEKNFLEMHLEANDGKSDRLLGGAVDIRNDHNYWILSDNIATFHRTLTHTEPGTRDILPTLNLSLPKILWDRIGGFDTKIITAGEDADFSHRARKLGCEVLFSTKPKLAHRHSRDNLASLLQHAYTFGEYSIKINPEYGPGESLPGILIAWPWLLLLFSPIIACGVIMKIVILEKLPLKFWHTLPVVKLAKIAWCFGAGKKLMRK